MRGSSCRLFSELPPAPPPMQAPAPGPVRTHPLAIELATVQEEDEEEVVNVGEEEEFVIFEDP